MTERWKNEIPMEYISHLAYERAEKTKTIKNSTI